jgi:hypothetical protein
MTQYHSQKHSVYKLYVRAVSNINNSSVIRYFDYNSVIGHTY